MWNLKPLGLFAFFFALACERIFIKTHNIESRCIIGQENTLFAGASVHLSAQKFTGWGSEGIKTSDCPFSCWFWYNRSCKLSNTSLSSGFIFLFFSEQNISKVEEKFKWKHNLFSYLYLKDEVVTPFWLASVTEKWWWPVIYALLCTCV